MILVIREPATAQQLEAMLEPLSVYIKVAVDIRQGILAGGGVLHADCEAALLEAGSQQGDIWGADWIPEGQQVRYEALINIRPRQGNRRLEIEDSVIREQVGAVVRRLMRNA